MLRFMLDEMEERVYRRVLKYLLEYKPKDAKTAFRLAVILSANELGEALDVLGDPTRLFSIDQVNEVQAKLAVAHARLQSALAPENQAPGE